MILLYTVLRKMQEGAKIGQTALQPSARGAFGAVFNFLPQALYFTFISASARISPAQAVILTVSLSGTIAARSLPR